MIKRLRHALLLSALLLGTAQAQSSKVIDVPTRSGVTERILLSAPAQPRAVVLLFNGSNGQVEIKDSGELGAGRGNFLLRTRTLWNARGLASVVVAPPSDHNEEPFLADFRNTPEHAADVQALISQLRQQFHVPVWLVGTSRGTLSAAAVASRLAPPAGPDGIVLTSSILSDSQRSVTALPLDALQVPVLLVHHKRDACRQSNPAEVPTLLRQIASAPRSEVMYIDGGQSQGDPCDSYAYHGFNGTESLVIDKIADWILKQDKK
jgi:dienelactone hydrolase